MGMFDMFKKKKEKEDLFSEEDLFKEPEEKPQMPIQERGMDRAFDTGIPQTPEPKVTFGTQEPDENTIRPRLEPTKLETIPANRDTDLILSRLDAIKISLDNINLRLDNMERANKEKKLW